MNTDGGAPGRRLMPRRDGDALCLELDRLTAVVETQHMSGMTDKEELIVAAALRVFARYGLQRATMNDVAEEAGVVRQTLYNVFANKHEMIDGAVRYYMGQLRAQTRAEWADAPALADRIDILFRYNVITPWDMLRATPDAKDLEAGTHAATKAALKDAEARGQEMVAELFGHYVATLNTFDQTPASVSAYVMRSMFGIKHGADDREDLLAMLETLKTSIRIMVGDFPRI